MKKFNWIYITFFFSILTNVILIVILSNNAFDNSNCFYEQRLETTSSNFIVHLNNNPIDLKFKNAYLKSSSEEEEIKILSDWINAYDKNIKDLTNKIKNSQPYIKDQSFKKSFDEALIFSHNKNLKFCNMWEDYFICTRGSGTAIHELIGLEELNNKRLECFELAEIYYDINGYFELDL